MLYGCILPGPIKHGRMEVGTHLHCRTIWGCWAGTLASDTVGLGWMGGVFGRRILDGFITYRQEADSDGIAGLGVMVFLLLLWISVAAIHPNKRSRRAVSAPASQPRVGSSGVVAQNER